MTYTFKLSRRLARLRAAALATAAQLIIACNSGDSLTEPGSVDSSDDIRVVILPDSTVVEVNQQVQFQAIMSGDAYTSATTGKRWGKNRKVVKLDVSPVSSNVAFGGSRIFNATATLN